MYDLQQAIKQNDIEYLIEFLLTNVNSTYIGETPDCDSIEGRLRIVYDYFYTRIKKVADEYDIKPTKIDLIDKLKAGNLVLTNKIDNLKTVEECNKLILSYEALHAKGRRYINSYFENIEEANQELCDLFIEYDDWSCNDEFEINQEDVIVSESIPYGWSCDDKLKTIEKWYQFIFNLREVVELSNMIIHNRNVAWDKTREVLLKSFTDDTEFYSELLKIMTHDEKNVRYWYHGTQDVESAYSILEKGLVLARPELTTTAYAEFKPDELLLYSRGLGGDILGEIGSSAVVIFKQPIDKDGQGIDIVKNNDKNVEVVQSGMGGFEDKLKYIIPRKYIVGIVNKQDHKIIYANELVDNQNVGLK